MYFKQVTLTIKNWGSKEEYIKISNGLWRGTFFNSSFISLVIIILFNFVTNLIYIYIKQHKYDKLRNTTLLMLYYKRGNEIWMENTNGSISVRVLCSDLQTLLTIIVVVLHLHISLSPNWLKHIWYIINSLLGGRISLTRLNTITDIELEGSWVRPLLMSSLNTCRVGWSP